MSFQQLALHPQLLKSLEKSGYTEPTPVQAQAIPCGLSGSDLLVSAQTGTGKTAAFVLPILHRLASTPSTKKGRGPRALILTPTRELAQQVSDAARTYAQFLDRMTIVSIVGGVPYERQRFKLRRPIEIIVATPGRLIDYLGQKAVDLSRVETLVLDEADRMLDMGFVDAVREIAEALPAERQTLFFSATLGRSVAELAGNLLKDPVRISVTPEKTRHELIEQSVQFVATTQDKNDTLTELLRGDSFSKAIVFVATKRAADEISYGLNSRGLRTLALHGDMRQGARNRTVRDFSSNEVNVVIATDVAARGLDVKDIELVVNYDLPRQSEDYVHRIGRTGRAGAKGRAISLAYNKEKRSIATLERYLGHQLTKTFSEASKREEEAFHARKSGGRPERRDRAPFRERREGRPFRESSGRSHSASSHDSGSRPSNERFSEQRSERPRDGGAPFRSSAQRKPNSYSNAPREGEARTERRAYGGQKTERQNTERSYPSDRRPNDHQRPSFNGPRRESRFGKKPFTKSRGKGERFEASSR